MKNILLILLTLLPGLALAQPRQDWWRAFADPEMDALVQAALAANGNIQAGQSRVSAARVNTDAARAYYLPNLYLDPLVQSQSLAPNRPLPISTGSTVTLQRFTLNSFNLPVDLAYDLNFWTKKNLIDQANNSLAQAGVNLEQTQLNLAGQVVQQVVAVRQADLALIVLERNIGLLDSVQRILDARYKAGLINEVQVTLNRTQLQSLTVDLEENQRARAEAIATLEALTNRPNIIIGRMPGLPALPPVDTTGSAQAILQRPDVKLYSYQISQGKLLVEQASYARRPRPFVQASSGFTTKDPSELIARNSFTYTVAAGIAIPIWDARANRYQVRAYREETHARESLYRQINQDARGQVRAATANIDRTARQINANALSITTAERAIRLSAELYTKGLTSFLELLNAEQNIINLQTRQAALQGQYLRYLVDYYQARGGR